MARSRKKTLSQNVVDVATTGMPQPVKKLLGKRVVALLIVLCVPVLYATGLVSVRWENGRPRVEINRQRAAQVKQDAVQQIQELQDRHGGGRAPTVSIPPLLDRQSNKSMGDRIEGLKGELEKKLKRDRPLKPGNSL
jgi:hypothetical protein